MIRVGCADKRRTGPLPPMNRGHRPAPHPNLVHIYEIGDTTANPSSSLEYVAGGTLASFIPASRVPEESARLVETLARPWSITSKEKSPIAI